MAIDAHRLPEETANRLDSINVLLMMFGCPVAKWDEYTNTFSLGCLQKKYDEEGVIFQMRVNVYYTIQGLERKIHEMLSE